MMGSLSFSIIEFFLKCPLFLYILQKDFQDTMVFFDNRTAFTCSTHYLSMTPKALVQHPPLCKVAFILRHLF